jgi:hypothetical protein
MTYAGEEGLDDKSPHVPAEECHFDSCSWCGGYHCDCEEFCPERSEDSGVPS